MTRHNSSIYLAMREIGIDQFYIELLENYPCGSKEQLNAREGHCIREQDSYNNGYNGKIEGRTPSEWYVDNAEQCKTKVREYQREHAEKRNAQYACQCGGKYTYPHKAHHLGTLKHQRHLRAEAPVEFVIP